MMRKSKIALIIAGAAIVLVGFFFGPQVFRRGVDYVSQPDPPPPSAHWTLQTAHFVQWEIERDQERTLGWFHPEDTTADDVTLTIDPSKPFSFSWTWSRHPTVDISFDMEEDGSAVFWIGQRNVQDPSGSWNSEYCGVRLRFNLTQAEMSALAACLNNQDFGDMPKEYALAGMSDGWWWDMYAVQGGVTKRVEFNNLFPTKGREIAAFVMREFAVPRAAEFDKAERQSIEERNQRQQSSDEK